MFAPVPVTTNMPGLPTAPTVTLPFRPIAILLLPFCTKPLLTVVMLPVVITAVVAPRLPTLALPLTLTVPVIFAPVPVTTRTLALPADPTVTLPFAATTIFEFPFVRLDELIVDQTKVPEPLVCKY